MSRTERRWGAAVVAALLGCASPVKRNGPADGAGVDAAVNDGGEEDRDATAADRAEASADATAEDAEASVDAAVEASVDAAEAVEASVDATAEDVEASVDAAAEDVEASVDAADAAVEAGPPTMRLTFVGGALRGDAGAMSMRAVITWHGGIRGQSADGGITFRGWFR